MREYRPDRWMIVELSDGNEAYQKVFSGDYGGYLGSDTWKLSSAIEHIQEIDKDTYIADCQSGSRYILHKGSYGASNYMSSIYYGWEQQSKTSGVTIKVVEGYDSE